MKILYYTAGTAGSGRLVRGIAIGNALKRLRFQGEFLLLSSSEFAHLADLFEMEHLEIPLEGDTELSQDNYRNSLLYTTILELKPDVLIIDLLWFPLYYFIDELKCTKLFLCHQVVPGFFSIRDPDMDFIPSQYDYLIGIEPFESEYNFLPINPLITRNRDEIHSRSIALEKLNLNDQKKNALFAINARPGDFERLREKYEYLENDFDVTYSTNYRGGLFPVIDYFNAFDLVVCLAGYNQFWECRYFKKEAVFETISLNFSSMEERIRSGENFSFDVNGADQLAEMVVHG